MEAIEFIKALERYCDNQCKCHGGCDDCKFASELVCGTEMQFDINFIDIPFVEYIEKWAKENPVKTRQSKFLEMYPDAKIEVDGVLGVLPCLVDKFCVGNCSAKYCKDCRHNYWLHEVEE